MGLFNKKKQKDEESSDATLNRQESDEYGHLEEYDALNKYIGNYKDPRRGSIFTTGGPVEAQQEADDAPKARPWWAFWRGGNSKQATGKDAGVVPEEMLDVDIFQGIGSSEVEHRRRRYGFNEIATEKENMILKFFLYFTGPILYGKRSILNHTVCGNFYSIEDGGY